MCTLFFCETIYRPTKCSSPACTRQFVNFYLSKYDVGGIKIGRLSVEALPNVLMALSTIEGWLQLIFSDSETIVSDFLLIITWLKRCRPFPSCDPGIW